MLAFVLAELNGVGKASCVPRANYFLGRGVSVNLAEVVLNLSQTQRVADKNLSYVLCVHISLLGARLGRELGP